MKKKKITHKCTHLLRFFFFFDRKFFKLQRYTSVTLYLSPKNTIIEGSKKITYTKIKILPQNNFPD